MNVDRVIRQNISDQQTAIAALQAGEIDYFETPPADLYPMIGSDPNLELQVLNKPGLDVCLRLNHLQKPFDNLKARQALIDQEAFMRVMSPDPKYSSTALSIFGEWDSLLQRREYTVDKNGSDPDRAGQLFQEAGHNGKKVVILQH